MPQEPDPQALLTALTTEHFTLQGLRASTISESGSRAALYLGSVSSTLIAIGFIGTIAEDDRTLFHVFTLTVLPTLYMLGLFAYVRLLESSIEDLLYGRAINRIRHHYIELAGDRAELFMLSAHDDVAGVMANMGIYGSRFQSLFTAAGAVAVVNGVVGGSAVAVAVGVAFDPPLGIAIGAGAIAAVSSVIACTIWSRRAYEQSEVRTESLFPTP